MKDCREEEINTFPLEADGNQEVFDFTLSPFRIKESEFKLRQDGSLGGWRGDEPAIFLVCWLSNSIVIPCPHN